MPVYDAKQYDPPAPVAHVTLHHPATGASISDVPMMLDTGVRAGEASRLNIKDLNLETGEVYIAPFGRSQTKTKSRIIPIGKVTRRVL
jgi:integrase